MVSALSRARRNEELPAPEQLERTERALEADRLETLEYLVADLSDRPRLPAPGLGATQVTTTGTRRGFLIGLGCLLVGTATGATLASVDPGGAGEGPPPSPPTEERTDPTRLPDWSDTEMDLDFGSLNPEQWFEPSPDGRTQAPRRSPSGRPSGRSSD